MEGRPGRQFSGGKLMRQPWIEMYLLTHMRPAGMERVEGENVVIWRNSSMQRGGSFHCQVIDVEIQDGTIILADGCHSILAKLTKECREDLDPEKLGYRFETLSGKLIIPQVFSIHARRTFTNVCVTLHVRKLQVWGGEGQFLRNPIDSIGLSKAVNSRLLALNITPVITISPRKHHSPPPPFRKRQSTEQRHHSENDSLNPPRMEQMRKVRPFRDRRAWVESVDERAFWMDRTALRVLFRSAFLA